MFLSTRTVLYALVNTTRGGGHPLAARSALILYVCENEDVLDAMEGSMNDNGSYTTSFIASLIAIAR